MQGSEGVWLAKKNNIFWALSVRKHFHVIINLRQTQADRLRRRVQGSCALYQLPSDKSLLSQFGIFLPIVVDESIVHFLQIQSLRCFPQLKHNVSCSLLFRQYLWCCR